MEEKIFIQNDGIYFEHKDREGWLVDRDCNILISLCLDNMELRYECNLNRGNDSLFRRTPLCYKKGHTIVLFPDKGEKILFYDEEKKIVNECDVESVNSVRIGIYCFGEFEDLLWAVSYGMKQIFLIDVERKRIVKRFKLFRTDDHIEMGYESILNGKSIYCVSRNSNYVSKTDIMSGEEKIYELPMKESGFNTIYYDGESFWLSSMSGSIYLWDNVHNIMKQVSEQSGTRYRSIKVGDTICFLPFNLRGDLCDELLCCEIRGRNCSLFPINGQQKEGIYAFEYVKDNRIIAISHSDNNFITEIDVRNGKSNMVYWNASEQYLRQKKYDEMKPYVKEGKILYEEDNYDIYSYLKLI